MTLSTLGIDAYQLTTLLAHADLGRLDQRVTMSFFFRRMPKNRSYVVFCALRRILETAREMRFGDEELAALDAHPMIGPALAARPAVREALRAVDGFDGNIDAIPEGTPAFAGPALRSDGKTPVQIGGAPLGLYTPLMQIETSMLLAKLIETPFLGLINHMSMIASKASRVVRAARGKPVLEFGQRRTHPAAAVDAAYAAYVGGCRATSNLAAYARFGIPAVGTMDHFAVQASEQEGRSREETERDFFRGFAETFGKTPTTMLVDTYDTDRGIRAAVEATGGALGGVRIDSNVTPESIARARALLRELGCPDAKIYVSDGLDEHKVSALADVADGFGVGENITCSPDAATGVGCVGKLVINGYGRVTMKVAKGTGKATLPGKLQVYRSPDHDLVVLEKEAAPSGATPLLVPTWRGREATRDVPSPEEVRDHVAREVDALPAELLALETTAPRKLIASDALVREVERLYAEASS